MKLYAIGDIHGCYKELIELLDLIYADIGENDAKIIFLGDYVDRGPDSALVVDHLNKLRLSEIKNIEYIFLKGNHEDMLIKAVLEPSNRDDYDMFWFNGGTSTKRSYDDNNFIFKDHKDFYYSLKRYYRHEDFVFVHAGLSPSKTFEMAVEEGFSWMNDDPLLWSRSWVDYDGEFPDNVFVVHGHTPVAQVTFNKNQINIDTGCVFGKEYSEQYGQLTAIRLDGRTESEIKIFQVRRKF